MKLFKLCLILVGLLAFGTTHVAFSASSKVATDDQINLLKQDLVTGRIKINESRLKKIRDAYGDAASINETESRITFDYGDLQLTFDKTKYLKKWEYDRSKAAAYTDDVESLIYDLESQQIVGDFWTYDDFKKDYGDPTEAEESDKDGQKSVYYYGEVKLTFENVYLLKSWRGRDLDQASGNDVDSLTSK